MASWEPVDIGQFDGDDIEDVHGDWGDDFKSNLEIRFNKLRKVNETLNESTNEDTIEMTEKAKDRFKCGTIELIANQMYDRLTLSFDNTRKRLGIHKGEPIVKPIRNYDSFKLSDDGALTYVDKRTVIDLGNINEGLITPWDMRRSGVKRLKSMGFLNITDEDVNPYKQKYKRRREGKLKKLDENLDQKSKAIESPSTTDAEAIEMTEVTSKDIDTTVKDVEQDTSFIKPSDRDNLLPLRELEGLDKQLRTIKGSLKVAIAKRVDLRSHIEHEERKLSEVQDPTYSDDQISMTEDRLRKPRDELTERNKEINILKGEASKQINQIRESITKFLDKETGTLGERIRTLFKEQGIMIVSILTAIGMAIGVLIEALLGGPSASTLTSGGTSGSDKKGGAREWIKKQIESSVATIR